MIQGTTITLVKLTQTGTNAFGEPIYAETSETVHDVLVGQPTEADQTNDLDLRGRSITYILGIPKGDTHEWKDQIVEIWGEKFMTVGIPIVGIEANVPTRWHKKVRVIRYE